MFLLALCFVVDLILSITLNIFNLTKSSWRFHNQSLVNWFSFDFISRNRLLFPNFNFYS